MDFSPQMPNRISVTPPRPPDTSPCRQAFQNMWQQHHYTAASLATLSQVRNKDQGRRWKRWDEDHSQRQLSHWACCTSSFKWLLLHMMDTWPCFIPEHASLILLVYACGLHLHIQLCRLGQTFIIINIIIIIYLILFSFFQFEEANHISKNQISKHSVDSFSAMLLWFFHSF